jgi:hypothetical protein
MFLVILSSFILSSSSFLVVVVVAGVVSSVTRLFHLTPHRAMAAKAMLARILRDNPYCADCSAKGSFAKVGVWVAGGQSHLSSHNLPRSHGLQEHDLSLCDSVRSFVPNVVPHIAVLAMMYHQSRA